MPAQLEEIEGPFCGEVFRRGEWIIGKIETLGGPLIIKGDAEIDELELRSRYRFYGRFTTYKSERQFQFQTFVPATAHDKTGIVEYLAKVGEGNGVGRATAIKVWDRFGSDSVRVIREDTERLAEFQPRITANQIDAIRQKLVERKAIEDATIDVINLLASRGFPKTTPRKAVKKWGNLAATVIRKDPYALMNFRGCGFKLCDTLWLELGHPADRIRRQALCAWHAVASNTDGHTWFPVELVQQYVRQSIGSANATPDRAIELATRLARLSPNHYGALAKIATNRSTDAISLDGDRLWIAEGKKASAELQLADSIAQLTNQDTEWLWPDPSSIQGVDDHQREKLGDALKTPLAILGGGPGTGKTYATAMLIKTLMRSGQVSPDDIAIGCPTGKAAVRITEALHAAGVKLKATTWHSLLGVGASDEEHGGWSFQHNERNPWSFKIIVGDEMSMCDTALMRSIFAARPRGCHVLFVGDVNQLPPVGNGAPLRDIIASNVIGYGELTEIKRNSGGIVEACSAIRHGRSWSAGDNLKVNSGPKPIEQMVATLELARTKGFDPVWDCQVLVAVNDKSPLSRKKINAELQSVLNPNPEIKGTPFRIDDKIVCLKNGYFTAIEADDDSFGDDDQVRVANGELARVEEIEEKYIVAELSNPRRLIRIPRGKQKDDDDGGESTGCKWDLAYGLSCHKSQGSEWPVVIVMLDEYAGARQVCSREWIYTAISRAKSKCVLVGKKATADAMCRRVAIGKRKTFLRERIQLLSAADLLGAM